MPARGAMAEPPMPIMWRCFICFCGLVISLHHSGLENFQSAIAGRMKASLNAEGQGQHRAPRVADGRGENNGHAERTQNALANVVNRGAALDGGLRIRELAKDDSLHRLEFSRLLQMHQRAV